MPVGYKVTALDIKSKTFDHQSEHQKKETEKHKPESGYGKYRQYPKFTEQTKQTKHD
jgi:hypothetical protein